MLFRSHGGLLVEIAKWAAQKGVAVELTGVDSNSNSIHAARKRFSEEKVDVHVVLFSGADLGSIEDNAFDITLSTQTLHHLVNVTNLKGFLTELHRTARYGFLITDCCRVWYVPLSMWIINTPPFGNDPLIRHDGVLSWRRAYNAKEMRFLVDNISELESVTIKRHPLMPYFVMSEEK